MSPEGANASGEPMNPNTHADHVARPDRRLVQIAGAVLLSVFVVIVVQKQIRFGGSAQFDAVRSLLFNLLMIVPFVAMIHAGTILNRRFRNCSAATRAAAIVLSTGLSIGLYIVMTGGVLYLIGLSSSWPDSPFVGKYISGAMYVHAALYLFVQLAVDRAGRERQHPPGVMTDARSMDFSESVSVSVAGVDSAEIRRVESWDHYVKVHTADGTHIERATMQEIEERLPDTFMRVHRRHIVNMAFVESESREARKLFLIVDGERIRVSDSYRSKVSARI